MTSARASSSAPCSAMPSAGNSLSTCTAPQGAGAPLRSPESLQLLSQEPAAFFFCPMGLNWGLPWVAMFPGARSRAGQPAGTSRAARVPCSRSFFRPSFRPTPGPSPGAAFRAILQAILQAIFQARTDPLSDSAFGRLPEQVLNRQGGRFGSGPDQVWIRLGTGPESAAEEP